MSLNLPPRGLSYPHVNNGDTTVVCVTEDKVYILVDLNHCQDAENGDDVRVPIIDRLKDELPKKNGKPYLSLFILTHPDQDHCRGFKRLLDEITIGEIIHTPRIFREYEKKEKLCDDAKAFREEADRRRKKAIDAGGDPGAGHRVRVIGYDDLFKEERYKRFPEKYRHSAGNTLTVVDGEDLEDVYEMFVHGPLRDEHGGERNDSSLAFQLVLKSDNGEHELKAFFLGDRTAAKIWSVIKATRDHGNDKFGRLDWNVLLASHHCSKYALFEKDENDTLKPRTDVIDALADGALEPAYVVASCKAVDDDGNSAFTDGDGDLPPHTKARRRYETMVESADDFLCTGEQPDTKHPKPIVFEVDDDGVRRVDGQEDTSGSSGDGSSAKEAWGASIVVGGREPSRKTIDHG